MAAKQRNKKKSEVSVSTEIHNPSLPDQEKAKAHSSASAKDESAEQKISRLEKELREARLRADFYEEMINVAEKRFDIQIRKKLAPNDRDPACTGPEAIRYRAAVQIVWHKQAGIS